MMLDALALQLVAMVALAVAMPRHGRHMLGRLPGRREERAASALGWILLALSLVIAVGRYGGAIAFMTWVGALALSAGAVLLLLAIRPRWPLPLAGAVLLAAGAALL